MATYYVDYVNGLDANNGLGPDASAATNKPWKTLAKAMDTGTTVVAGDTVYLAPGVHYSVITIAPPATVSSTASPTAYRGDPTNVQGFKTSGGVRVAPGAVWLTNGTSAEGIDSARASTANLISCSGQAVNGLQFYNIAFDSGTASIFSLSMAGNADFKIENCLLVGGSAFSWVNSAPTASRNLTVRSCFFIGSNLFALGSVNTAAATANADVNILVEGVWSLGRLANNVALGSGSGNVAGGIRFKGCHCYCPATTAINTTATKVSTTVPITLEGCIIATGVGTAINAGTAGSITGHDNRFWSNTPQTNYTYGTNDVINPQWRCYTPMHLLWGLNAPLGIEGFLGWADDSASTQYASAWSTATQDIRNTTARPWGSGPSIGAIERLEIVKDTSSALAGGGVNSVKITGAGEFTMFLQVEPVPTTFSIKTKSTSYGGTNYPQLIVVASPDVGLTSDQTVAATSGTEQTITSPSFTPTAQGVVEVRLVSRSSSVSSVTYFDDA